MTGSLIGVLVNAEFDQVSVTLAPGDSLILYTDGVTESRRGRDLFGEERLVEVIARAPREDPEALLDAILAAALDHAGGEPQDDIALMALRLSANGAPAPRGIDGQPATA